MDAVDILKVCLHRWYVMLPILVGAAGVSYQMVQAQETSYTAATSYGLVQPSLRPGVDEEEVNPLGPSGDALVGAALEAQLNSRETQAELGSDATRGWGPGDVVNHRSYDVRIPQYETTYEVRAWGEDEQELREVVNRVIEAAPGIADELQDRAGVPVPQRFRPFVLAPTQVEALPSASGIKLTIAVMGVGLLMGAAWSIVVDRGLRWRQASRHGAVAKAGTRQTGTSRSPGGAADENPSASSQRQLRGIPPSKVNGASASTSPANGRGRVRVPSGDGASAAAVGAKRTKRR